MEDRRYWDSNPYESEGSWYNGLRSSGGGGGSGADIASSAAPAAAAAFAGNPYSAAAVAGLKVIEMVAKRKEEERKAKYQAQLNHQDSVRGAIDRIIGVSQGLRNL